MKDKQAFIDALELQQDEDGHWYVAGNVDGSVEGYVFGNVGSIWGNVEGTINGREWKFVEENDDES